MASNRPRPSDEDILAALDASGGNRSEAARSLGVNRSNLSEWVSAIEYRKRQGVMEGETACFNGSGEKVLSWIRGKKDQSTFPQDFVDALCERVRGRVKVPKRPERKSDTDQLLYEVVVADPHIGMYATKSETRGDDYDNKEASRRVLEGAHEVLERERDKRPHVVNLTLLGDTLHADGRIPTTERSGNILDTDTRYEKIVDRVCDIATEGVAMCSQYGAEVRVVVVPGNHDPNSSVWLKQVLKAAYNNCDHVTVDDSQSPRKSLTWGENLLVWAHGDQVKRNMWASVIPTEFRKEWGKTRYHHLKLGHIHHQKKIPPLTIDEQSGLLIEYLPAVCPSDAWHVGAGYLGAQKGILGYLYHKGDGLITRQNKWF